MFGLHVEKGVLWDRVAEIPAPKYLVDNVERVMKITCASNQSNEAFSRTVIDQIMISAVYEESFSQSSPHASSNLKGQAVLGLQHETRMQKEVLFKGERRLLSGAADYTVSYEPENTSSLPTNLIIVEAKRTGSTDFCLGQLTAYMGIVHSCRKDEKKENCIVYGAASDGSTFRFCRINNDSGWTRSRMLDWDECDRDQIYTIFRSLIKIAAMSSPSTSPVKDPENKGKVLASFGSPVRARHFDYGLTEDYDLPLLKIVEEDDDTEIITIEDMMAARNL